MIVIQRNLHQPNPKLVVGGKVELEGGEALVNEVIEDRGA